MPSLNDKLTSLLPKLCSRFLAVEVLYLFGSQTRPCAREPGDIDIAVFLDPDTYIKYPLLDLDIGVFLQDSLKKEVDIVVLNTSSAVVQHEVLRTGVRLFTRDHEKRAQLELNAFREYLDLSYFQEKRIRERLPHG